jgi:FemAB-related protein (PEP-CTERM system-associated)
MQIVRCDDSHHKQWNEFVDRTPEASFYHRFEWRSLNRRCFGHESSYLAAVADDRVVGVFPVVRLKSWLFGHVACSLPFVNYGGPCAISPEIETALLQEAGRVAAEWGVDYVEIRSRKHLGDAYATSTHKVSLTVDLTQGHDAVWKAFKTAHRQDIRGGYKKGFTAKLGGAELLDDLYSVLSEAWRDLGTPLYRKQYLEDVTATFRNLVRLCVVYHDGEAAAASFQAYDNGTAEGLWLGSRAKYRQQYAGYVLYWEILKDASLQGCQRFHLGRSTANSGTEAFKKKWNAHTTQLYWHYVLRGRRGIPRQDVNNPKYKLAIKAWRKLPVPVANAIGPIFARNIP